MESFYKNNFISKLDFSNPVTVIVLTSIDVDFLLNAILFSSVEV